MKVTAWDPHYPTKLAIGTAIGSVSSAGIQGVPVNPTAPADGQVLVFDAASGTWIPTTLAAATGFVTVIGGGKETVSTVATSGAAQTYDLASGNWLDITLTANCTITVQGFTAGKGCSAVVKVTQDGTGGRTVTWDPDIVWAAGASTQPTTTAGVTSWFELVSNQGDSVIYGFPVGGGGSSSAGVQLASITAASAAIAATETVVVSASLNAGAIVAGTSYLIQAAGTGTTGLTPGTDTFRIRIGPTTLTGTIPTSTTATGVASVTGQPFSFTALVTVRTDGASGTIIGECEVASGNVATGRYTLLSDLSTTTASVAVDTTVANLLQLTYISGNAGSSNTFQVASIVQFSTATGPAGLVGSSLVLTGGDQTSTSATFTDLSGASITLTTGAHRCRVVFMATIQPGSGGYCAVDLVVDGTRVGNVSLGLAIAGNAAVQDAPTCISYLTSVLTAGSHTFKAQMARISAGTATVFMSNPAALFSVEETSITT